MKLQYNDAQHAYWLDGKRCKSVTTVAKIPEDTFRLEQWSQRQVAIGLATKPSLLERVSANVDNNSAINAICEEAAREAGAHEGRDRGNVLHTALEAHDLGKRFIPTDLTSAAIIGWEQICESMGWTVELVERCVVWPEQLIAGRFDRIVKDREGNRFIVDFKGGAKVVNYPHAIACQLALYANAPLLAGPIPGDGGFTEDFEPLTILDGRLAYVVHLPPDGDAQLIEIDILAAWPVIRDVIFPTIAWRAAKGLAKVVELPEQPKFLDALAASKNAYIEPDPFAGLPGEPAPVLNPHPKTIDPILKPVKSVGLVEEPRDPAKNPVQVVYEHDNPFHERKARLENDDLLRRQDNLRDRLNFLKNNHPAMAQVVASRWPEGVPNIRMPLTADDLDRIEAIVIEAERQVEAPFNPPSDAEHWNAIRDQMQTLAVKANPPAPVQPINVEPATPPADTDPAREPVDEGPNMEPADIEAFKGAFAALDNELQIRIDAWAREAQEVGTSISMRSTPSKRRFSIGRFALLACHHHEDVVRAVLALVLGDEIQPVVTTGSVLGVLTQPEAEKAWELMLAIDGKTLVWDGFGKLVAA